MGISSGDFIFTNLEKLPEPGIEVFCEDFVIKPGGAANTPCALEKLGLSVAFVTTLGKDLAGSIVYNNLKDCGFDMSPILYHEKARTTVSAVLSQKDDRAFATFLPPSDKELEIAMIRKFAPLSKHIHAYMFDCFDMPILEIAAQNRTTLSVDTSWSETVRLKDIRGILECCDIFFANEQEACRITDSISAEKALEILASHAKATVVVKLGSKGSLVCDGSRTIRIPAIAPGEIVDTTGCGDVFCAGFLYGFLKGWPVEKSALFGSVTGGLTATFFGGVDDRFTKETVMHHFSEVLQSQQR